MSRVAFLRTELVRVRSRRFLSANFFLVVVVCAHRLDRSPSYIIETLVPWRDEATFAKSERCVEVAHAGTDSQRNFINDRQLINDRRSGRLAHPCLIAAVALPPSRHAPPSADSKCMSPLCVKSFGMPLLLLMRMPCERADRRVS